MTPVSSSPRLVSALQRLGCELERSAHGGPMLLAAAVGLATGSAALLFDGLLRLVQQSFAALEQTLVGQSPWRAATPAVGGALVAMITLRWVRETRGQGISDTIAAVGTGHGRIRPVVAPARAVATALTIGSGGSAGRVGPVTQIGGALGSGIGQALGVSDDMLRLLTAAGVAGGVSAMFNAPIAGVFFALEVVLRRITARNFGIVVLAAVVATLVSEAARGDSQAIVLPAEFRVVSVLELPLYAGLGLVIAPAAVAFATTFNLVDTWIRDRWRREPLWLPAIGGGVVGVCGLMAPGVLGEGLESINQALAGDLERGALVTLFFLKAFTVIVTLTTGGSGGLFRPTLFLGAMIGAGFGVAVHSVLPPATEEPGAYAVAGMAGFFAATSHAPISAVLMLFEMTRDHALVLPLMTTVAVSTGAAVALRRDNIYAAPLRARGVHLEDANEQRAGPLHTLTARDAMTPVVLTATPDSPVTNVMRRLAADPDAVTVLQREDGTLAGVVSNSDLNDAIRAGLEGGRAGDIASWPVRTVFADQTLHEALSLFASYGVHGLPVVDRREPGRVQGVLRRSDVTQAYSAAVERLDAQTRRARVDVPDDEEVQYLELRVGRHSPVIRCALRDAGLREEAVVVAVRRGGRTIIPRGTTRLEAGDRITLIATPNYAEELRHLFEGEAPQ